MLLDALRWDVVGNGHAAGLLIMAGLPILAARDVRGAHRRVAGSEGRPIASACAVGAALLLVHVVSLGHVGCGIPVAHVVLPAWAVGGILILGSGRRSPAVFGVIVCAAWLNIHYVVLPFLHGTGYTCSTVIEDLYNRRRDRALGRIRERLGSSTREDTTLYSAGWADEVGLLAHYPELDAQFFVSNGTMPVVSARWHSRLTKIYSFTQVRIGLWCPGGSLAEVCRGVEFRPRA